MFTRAIGSWWPLETHALHPGQVREVVWEEREGGEVYEISTDGERSHWATVLAWAPPTALTIAWQVDPDGRGDDGGRGALHARGRGTRVDLEHRRWERLGADRRARRARATAARTAGRWCRAVRRAAGRG